MTAWSTLSVDSDLQTAIGTSPVSTSYGDKGLPLVCMLVLTVHQHRLKLRPPSSFTSLNSGGYSVMPRAARQW